MCLISSTSQTFSLRASALAAPFTWSFSFFFCARAKSAAVENVYKTAASNRQKLVNMKKLQRAGVKAKEKVGLCGGGSTADQGGTTSIARCKDQALEQLLHEALSPWMDRECGVEMFNLAAHRALQVLYSTWECFVHDVCSATVTALFEEFLDKDCLREPWRSLSPCRLSAPSLLTDFSLPFSPFLCGASRTKPGQGCAGSTLE